MTSPGTARTEAGGSLRRARRSFWILVTVAVLAAGWMSAALAADVRPLTGLQVAASGIVLIAAITLAARVLAAVDRARRRSGPAPTTKG